MVTGHGKLRSYVHRFGLTDNPMSPCEGKEAAVGDGPVVYDKITRELIITREKENGLHSWQQQWTNAGKGAVTKAFFPVSEE